MLVYHQQRWVDTGRMGFTPCVLILHSTTLWDSEHARPKHGRACNFRVMAAVGILAGAGSWLLLGRWLGMALAFPEKLNDSN